MLDIRKPGQVVNIEISPFANEFLQTLKNKTSNPRFVPMRSDVLTRVSVLSRGERRVWDIVMWALVNGGYNEDRVYLTTNTLADWVTATNKPFSRRSFEQGRAALIEREFLHKANMRGFYWVNTSIAFVGDPRSLRDKYKHISAELVKD